MGHNPSTVFDYDGICSAFDLKKAGIIRLVGITSDAKLEPIFTPLHTFSAQLQIV
jgi:hypothetical protein